MEKSDYQRLIKIEERLYQYAEEYGLKHCPIEWDIVPDEKMLEIMAYHIPGNISNWKFGRDYERLRTINEHVHSGLPYEVVINSDPSRAYLMKSNTLGVQILVMAHVLAHVSFFTMNKYFVKSKKDIIQYMQMASERFLTYEKRYGIDDIEKTVDAAHAIQFHSSPFDNETEEQKRERIFEYERRKYHNVSKSEFRDLFDNGEDKVKKDIERFNQELWRKLKRRTPVEPTADLLRYIIDNSNELDDWQQDICEVLRTEGRYYWPQIKTKFMNEGFATYWHEVLIERLYRENLITNTEHAEFTYSNALVKATHPKQMNPYLVGWHIWKNIVERWDKGQHGKEYEQCEDSRAKSEWDTGAMEGHKKMMEVMSSYTDWFFVQDFLTPELVKEMKMYIYVMKEGFDTVDFVITRHDAKQVAEIIIQSFAHSHIPLIEIIDGNYKGTGKMLLEHQHSGADLDMTYAKKTMEHISILWGNEVALKTLVNDQNVLIAAKDGKSNIITRAENKAPVNSNIWTSTLSPFELPNPVVKLDK